MSLTLRLRDQIESLVAYKGQGETFYVQQQTVSAEAGTEFVNQDFVNTVKGPGKVFKTLADAVDACVSGRGDEVVLLPGWYTLTDATKVAVSKSDVTIRSLSSEKKRSTVIDVTGSNYDGLTVSGSDCTVKDMTFHGNAADVTCIKATGMSTSILNCEFRGGDNGCNGIEISNASAEDMDAAYITIKDCLFSRLLNGITVSSTGATTGLINYLTVQSCTFLAGKNPGSNTFHFGMSGTWEGSHGLSNLLLKDLDMCITSSLTGVGTTFYTLLNPGASCDGLITGLNGDVPLTATNCSGVDAAGNVGWTNCLSGGSGAAIVNKPS